MDSWMPSMQMSQKGLLTTKFLDTSKIWPSETTKKMKAAVLLAACGGAGNDSVPVVELEDDEQSSRPGPAAKSHELQLVPVVIICFSMRFGLYRRFAYIKCICETHYIKLIMK
jgi:hypothetical protein